MGIANDIEKVTRLLRLTEGEENSARFQIVVNKSPSTLIKAVKFSNASVAITDYENNIGNRLFFQFVLKFLSLIVHQFISDSLHSNVEARI